MIIKFKQLHEAAVTPTQADTGAAGYDIYALENVHLLPNKPTKIRTGLSLEIPEGYFGAVYVRSGISLKQVTLANAVGVIDSSYRGELCVLAIYYGNERFLVEKGMRVAQLVVQPYVSVEFQQVDELGVTERGTGGFGSSGK